LREILATASVLGQHSSLLILDLDHFKSINDVFGHTRGDQILLEFVGRVSELVPGSDLLFRYGGDEFCAGLTPNQPGAGGGVGRAFAKHDLAQALCRGATAIGLGEHRAGLGDARIG